MAIEKIQVLEVILELPAEHHYQFLPIQPILLKNGPDGLNWQCSLAGSSKMASRIWIFSIAMGADYSFELISIETYTPQFVGHNKFFLGSVARSTITNNRHISNLILASLVESFYSVTYSAKYFTADCKCLLFSLC